MPDVARIEPKMIHSENISQDFEQKSDEKPWERKKNEPANWYMRFQIYLKLGTKRSLQAAFVSEPDTKKAPIGTQKHQGTKNLVDVSVPGSWKRASKLWNWVERARAHDLHMQELHAQVMRITASNYEYSSRAKRLIELNNLVTGLKKSIRQGIEIKDHIAIVARIQSVFHDIDAEMGKLGMQNEADAAALMTFLKQAIDQGDTGLLEKLREV
jgi:hypothetical protein